MFALSRKQPIEHGCVVLVKTSNQICAILSQFCLALLQLPGDLAGGLIAFTDPFDQ